MEESAPSVPKKRRFSRQSLISVAVVVLLILLAGTAYEWQQANNNAKSANTKLKSAQAENASLAQNLKKLQSDATSNLKVTIQKVKHFNGTPNQYNDGKIFTDGNDFLMVDVLLSNDSAKDVALSIGDFKLKSGTTTFPYYTNSAVGSQPRFTSGVEGLPSGYIELRSQTIRHGEKVTGTLLFYVPETTNDFTLYYSDQVLQVQST